MTQLMNKAKELDKEHGLYAQAIEERKKALRDWNRRVAKINAWMKRTHNNPPTDYDFKKLETVEHWFRKI